MIAMYLSTIREGSKHKERTRGEKLVANEKKSHPGTGSLYIGFPAGYSTASSHSFTFIRLELKIQTSVKILWETHNKVYIPGTSMIVKSKDSLLWKREMAY